MHLGLRCILLTERMILYMAEKKYMSGCQLRQYLHISTRKMKYLMDHNYIPHENTGHATHKYRVLKEDAEKFKFRMENEIGFLAELNGMFSNRTEWHPRPLIEVTEENCNAFRQWLENEWAELPDALPTQTAAGLVGHNPQSIHKLIKENVLHGIKIGAVQYIPKTEFISFMASPKKLATLRTEKYKELIKAFKYKQRREHENEQRRCKRRIKKEKTLIKKKVLTQEQIAEKLDYLRKQRDGLIVGDYRNYLYKLYMYLKERYSETKDGSCNP